MTKTGRPKNKGKKTQCKKRYANQKTGPHKQENPRNTQVNTKETARLKRKTVVRYLGEDKVSRVTKGKGGGMKHG